MRFTRDIWGVIYRYLHRDAVVNVHLELFKWLSWEDEGCVYKLNRCNYFYAFNWRVLSEQIKYNNIYRVPDEADNTVNYAIGNLPKNYVYSGIVNGDGYIT